MKKVILLSVFLVSCSSKGFHRESLRGSLDTPQVSDQAIADEFAKVAQLPKPFRLGVYFKRLEGEQDLALSRWREEDREVLYGMDFPKEEVKAVFPISEELVVSPDFRSVRLAGAKQGADAVLVISGAQKVNHSPNELASTYLLLFPLLFVKGTEVESLFLARALLWDVKNGFLYLGAEAEAEKSWDRPLAFPKTKELILSARREALEKLKLELVRQMKGITS